MTFSISNLGKTAVAFGCTTRGMGEDRVRLGFVRKPVLIAFMLAIASAEIFLEGQTPHELTNVRDIRALTQDQASAATRVRVRGVVTAVSGWKDSFFVQDATAGISVDRDHNEVARAAVHVGDRVEVIGASSAGLFAPLINASHVGVIGHASLPPARHVIYGDMFGGKEDSQWIEVEGIVRAARISELFSVRIIVLSLWFDGGSIRAFLQDTAGGDFSHFVDSAVRIRGVCSTEFNQKRQFVGVSMFVPNRKDIDVIQPANSDPFAPSATLVRNVLQFGQGAHRVKVVGVATFQIPGQALYLQDGNDGVRVQTSLTESVEPGRRVEAVGFPAMGDYGPILADGLYRVVGNATPIAPLRIDAKSVITQQEGFNQVPFDLRLVQLQGKVVETHVQGGQHVWILRQGNEMFEAHLALSSVGNHADNIGVDSVLLLTGICAVNTDADRNPTSFGILLRSSKDIVVLEHPPWWNASHAMWVVAFLVLVVLGLAAWLAVVRWQDRLRALTITDDLTGIYNRRGFFLLAEPRWQLARRRKASLLLFYIDVDNFKEINDSLGHREGDRALRVVAAALRDCFRKTDIIARMGGDEFAVFTDDASPESRQSLERRLTSTVEQSNYRLGWMVKLSLSIGVLNCDSSLGTPSIEDLLATADTLMYGQKKEHRPPN